MGLVSEFCCNEDEVHQRRKCSKQISSDSENDKDEEIDTIDNEHEIKKPIAAIKNIQISSNGLFMQRHQNPWQIYEEMEILGEGFNGIVKKVRLIKNPEVIRAMKIISENSILKGKGASLIDEIEILKNLDHPNIMKVYESFVYQGNYYIISELFDQGHLLSKLEKLGKMDEIVVKFIMGQIFNAVAYLHSKNIMHGDLKLENILMYKTSKRGARKFTAINQVFNSDKEITSDINKNYGKKKSSDKSKAYIEDMMNYEIKLIDFGCSKYFVKKNKKRKIRGIIGNSMYYSPEVVDNSYDEISDEWSCGVLMYILLSGEPPFYGETDEEIFDKIKKCDYTFSNPAFKEVSKNCKDLIRKLLEPKRKLRIRAKDALIHPFFTEEFAPTTAMTENKDFSYLNQLLNPMEFTSKFHEAILAYLCKNYMPQDEENNLRKLFRYIDKDGNNLISKKELKKCLNEVNIIIPEDEFDELFESLDENHSGYIEYQEFIRNACNIGLILSKKNLRYAFQAISQGKDSINKEDIKKFIFHDTEINEKTLEEYFDSFGIKNDDNFGFHDFYYMIKNNLKFGEKKPKKKSKFLFKGPVIEEKGIDDEEEDIEADDNKEEKK